MMTTDDNTAIHFGKAYTARPLLGGSRIISPLNSQADGTCRRLKATYYKSSVANFLLQTSRGATAVLIEYD